jgi:twitching motility two-component system response regulator PilG
MSQTVLLVDDSKTVRRAAEMVCEKGEIHLITAGDELEAKNQAESLHPSLMVVDCQMKEQSGYELLRDLRQNIEISHIPAIMLSSQQHVYDESLGREVGVVGHLQKPFDYETFTTCIQEILSQVPEDGQVDSIPPSTLPTPAQEAVRVAVAEAVQNTEPSHFEINMEESMPPTPINRQSESVIQELEEEDVLEASELADAEEDVLEASEVADAEEDVLEASEVADADEAVLETSEIADADEAVLKNTEISDAEEGEAQVSVVTQEETQEALVEEEIQSSDVIEEQALNDESAVAVQGQVTHLDLVRAAMERIPEDELQSLVRASIESVVWEVVPELAENLIKAEIQRILSEKTDN